MQLSTPIYMLKRNAKLLARQSDIALHQALDRIAIDEGFQTWSHLSSSASGQSPVEKIVSQLDPGDLVLLGARPGHGKTRLGLELASNAHKLGRKGYFFTLDYHERDVADQLSAIGTNPTPANALPTVDTSDDVSAEHVIGRLSSNKEPALAVIDYLQLLDQKRTNPSLEDQMMMLQSYAAAEKVICVVISQIDRSFDLAGKAMPETSDIRLPNPLDLSVFDKFFFLHNGKIQLDQAA
ncbi:MAG: DNA helicase [Rhizobiales bacterium]|nr:DNA helicase [Hyphomicrobiales bacterium]MBO6698920.1 DNA helicase [Hyphomicrobiales bacterium]MBO6734827.1 DNA helicase [Hyphomicrobiales bacterium]MBO6911367.1 DNA helicase [Hyphomicrobiales bacterium]MBO6955500.1 DNA helicase [Hyphomicrobiales bacterium]